ncbi:hypothetical protein NA57DRAFT_54376 [Rhizodiscina lignyota]|uniref:NlpC/P60 domain-containing protein n=1 Tax=Rhizodiscina lignyota TaxID=1504668 RepID=A0A9P4MC32_9PEZI|nr:hypothetical protein NA57DRAFT_54376 [Rhizodiscina lignyota]
MFSFFKSLTLFVLTSSALGNPVEDIFGRAVGDSCKAPLGSGTCKHTKDCVGVSYPTNLCPKDPDDVQCCYVKSCTANGEDGYCRSKKWNGCPGGDFVPNHCPGDDDIQCCVKGSTPPPSSVPQKIISYAKEQKGVDYVWGGGSCSGPTSGGFDCSGLLCYAICKATGRDLFKEGLRVTRTMYCAGESKLKYKKYAYSQRKAGDAVFFGGKCDCASDPEGIHHVGIMLDSGTSMWNALKTGTTIREDNFGSWSEKPCPYVIRFD